MSELEIVDLTAALPWNPDPDHNEWPQRDYRKIDKVILHQELGNGSVESVNAYHISETSHIAPGVGAPHIAYHYAIRKNGEIVLCNDPQDVTWHCKGQNQTSIGIMLVGDFTGPGHNGGVPTNEQREAFFELADYLMNEFDLSPEDFFGHCDFGKPACPGDEAYSWIRELKEKE